MNGVDPAAVFGAARAVARARRAVALTGAGISVESGIPDFRSPGGVWSIFDPEEYATLTCFMRAPDKAWRLYRAIAATLAGREPNAAHLALAEMEASRRIAGIVTQNIDGLHQRAGSRNVLEMHGETTRLQCLPCHRLVPIRPVDLEAGPVPRCPACGATLKPNIVLFEEPVRELPSIRALLDGCDLLLVVGTSAQVAPASWLPLRVLDEGGSLVEFNLEETHLTGRGLGPEGTFVRGPVGQTLPLVAKELRRIPSAGSGS